MPDALENVNRKSAIAAADRANVSTNDQGD